MSTSSTRTSCFKKNANPIRANDCLYKRDKCPDSNACIEVYNVKTQHNIPVCCCNSKNTDKVCVEYKSDALQDDKEQKDLVGLEIEDDEIKCILGDNILVNVVIPLNNNFSVNGNVITYNGLGNDFKISVDGNIEVSSSNSLEFVGTIFKNQESIQDKFYNFDYSDEEIHTPNIIMEKCVKLNNGDEINFTLSIANIDENDKTQIKLRQFNVCIIQI